MKLIASLLLLSACGATVTPDDEMSAAQPGAIQLDPAPFVDDGARWWTNQSALKLTGSYDGSPDARIDVQVNGTAVPAVLSGTTWMAQMPDGAVTPNDTLVTVLMTNPDGSHATREQMFALDDVAPIITIEPSTMHDEKGDVIEFSSGEPVHDHIGADIDLAASGCVHIWKYVYLMDRTRPYGKEASANPIRWNIHVDDIKVRTTEFRVRSMDGTVVHPWSAVTPQDSMYPVELYRDGIDGLNDWINQGGVFNIDFRTTDWTDRTDETHACIEVEALPAPLDVAQLTTSSGDADALTSWTLAANSPLSRLTNAGALGPIVATQTITQYSAEPVVLAFDAPTFAGAFSVDMLHGFLRTGYQAPRVQQCTSTSPCAPPPAPPHETLSGSFGSTASTVEVLRADTGERVYHSEFGYAIPGRQAGEAPVVYELRVRITVPELNDEPQQLVNAERVYGTLSYTGSIEEQTKVACARTTVNPLGITVCASDATYSYVRAINAIHLDVAATQLTLRAGTLASHSDAPMYYVSQSAMLMPAFGWDGGPKDLGGY